MSNLRAVAVVKTELKKNWLTDNTKNFLQQDIVLLLFLAFLGFVNLWVALGFTQISALSSESAKHLSKAYQMVWQIDCHWPWPDILNTITYPPCFYLNTAFWFKIFHHKSEALALLSIVPYLIISAWSVYGLIKDSDKQNKSIFLPLVGALTCLALLSSSLLIEGYLIEYALTAWLSAAFYFLTKISNPKLSLGQILAIIVVCSLGLLTKWTFLSYLLPLLLCIFFDILLSIIKGRYTKLELSSLFLKIAIILTSVSLLSGLWYGSTHNGTTNFGELLAHFSRSQNSEKILQTNDPIFLYGFRAHSTSWYRFGPTNFALYAIIHVIPPHLSLMCLIGALISISNLYLKLQKFGFANNTKIRIFSTPETAITLSLFFSVIFYSLYPTPELFVPEKSVRHLAPLAPVAVALAFIWLPRLGKRQILLLFPCYIISIVTLLHWAIPQTSSWRGHISWGPSLPSAPLRPFSDPLGLITTPYSSPLEKLCSQIAKKAEHRDFLVSLVNKEDFDPFFTELYAYLGSKPVFLLYQHKAPEWIDPLTQSTVPKFSHPNQDFKLVVQRYQITWLGYPQIQTVPELPHTFNKIPGYMSNKIHKQNKYFYIERSGQIDAYQISEYR